MSNSQRRDLVPPPELRQRVLGSAARGAQEGTDRGSTLWFSTRAALLALFGAAWLTSLWWVFGTRNDLQTLSTATWLPLVNSVLVSAIVTWIATSRGVSMVGRSVHLLLVTVVVTPAEIALATLGGVRAAVREPPTPLEESLGAALPCAGLVILVAVPLLVGLFWLRRSFVASAPPLSGATLGIAASAWAHAFLVCYCPRAETLHILVGHLLPMLPLALLGAWVARRNRHGAGQDSRA